MSPASAASFRRSLARWYGIHGRNLPWRHTTDPYPILVSEFMLQQTQVATVIPYFERWMLRFPDLASLASASEADVLHAWQGLGYYSRARNLRAAAIAVMNDHGGRFPRDLAAIRRLPGVGRYTANAIATFAFDEAVPIVEANIARVLSRLSDWRVPVDTAAGREGLWSQATALLPRRGRLFNSALMELGALVCTPRPRCGVCPVKGSCETTEPSSLPRKRPRRPLELRTEHHALIVSKHRVLLEQSADRWRGLWMLPRLRGRRPGEPIYQCDFPFTHHRITLAVHASTRKDHPPDPAQRWFAIRTLGAIALPSPHRRALTALLGAAPGMLA
ncbi:MAG TPA: A/G-specific adenine glycosylase [Chthoniobacterales bacterium]|nr:A/G-specific adenine glycosylase [Chthoniobacterales bacterium]